LPYTSYMKDASNQYKKKGNVPKYKRFHLLFDFGRTESWTSVQNKRYQELNQLYYIL
jgi:hypothetical protein